MEIWQNIPLFLIVLPLMLAAICSVLPGKGCRCLVIRARDAVVLCLGAGGLVYQSQLERLPLPSLCGSARQFLPRGRQGYTGRGYGKHGLLPVHGGQFMLPGQLPGRQGQQGQTRRTCQGQPHGHQANSPM